MVKILMPVLDMKVDNYVQAVKRAGAEPVVVHDVNREMAAEADGLLLPGGGDINPSRYGQSNQGSEGIDDALDEMQFAVLKMFVDEGKPVLGVCRGHQVINVFFGGDMIQNLETASKHARDEGSDCDKYHYAKSVEGSWMEELYGNEFLINSSHHQAVKTPGKDMVIDLFSTEDEVVEAAHHVSLPIWSVQWHPERCLPSCGVKDLVEGDRVFRFFVDQF